MSSKTYFDMGRTTRVPSSSWGWNCSTREAVVIANPVPTRWWIEPCVDEKGAVGYGAFFHYPGGALVFAGPETWRSSADEARAAARAFFQRCPAIPSYEIGKPQ